MSKGEPRYLRFWSKVEMTESCKTHCPAGHPYSGDNLILGNRGGRECRACLRASRAEYNREYKRRRRAAGVNHMTQRRRGRGITLAADPSPGENSPFLASCTGFSVWRRRRYDVRG